MTNETYHKARRKLSFLEHDQSQQPSFSQFYSHNHPSNYLQLSIHNLNQLIKQTEQQIYDEQQTIVYEENIRLNRIENLQNDINQIQTTIESLNRELEQLNSDTTEMLFRQNESALVRHHQLLKQSIEHINHVLRRRSNSNESLFDQLKVDLTSQQEKLFLIRNQLDIDQNKLTTKLTLIKQCQQQRNQYEQIKIKKQFELQNLQENQVDRMRRQLRLQRLQFSIEQQTRVRNEIQQLENEFEPKSERLSSIDEYQQELDLTKEKTFEIDERLLKTPE